MGLYISYEIFFFFHSELYAKKCMYEENLHNELIIREHIHSVHYLFELWDASVSGFLFTKTAELKKSRFL